MMKFAIVILVCGILPQIVYGQIAGSNSTYVSNTTTIDFPAWLDNDRSSLCRVSTINTEPVPSRRTDLISYDKNARVCWIFAIYRGVQSLSPSLECPNGLPVWLSYFGANTMYDPYVLMDLNEILVYELHHEVRNEEIGVLNDVGNITNIVKTMNDKVSLGMHDSVAALGKLLCKIQAKVQQECPDKIAETCPSTMKIAEKVQKSLKPIDDALRCVFTNLLTMNGDVVTSGLGPSVIRTYIPKIKACAAKLDGSGSGSGSAGGGLLGIISDLLNSLLNILPGLLGGVSTSTSGNSTGSGGGLLGGVLGILG